MIYPVVKRVYLLLFCASLYSCATISNFSERAYNNAVTTKVSALNVMDKATTSYQSNVEVIKGLLWQLDVAYEYDKGRELNATTVQMWDVLKDPQGHLLGGFLSEWKRRDQMSSFYIGFRKKQVASAFDQIIELEAGKQPAAPQ